jgi:uncharacterized Zn-finger protein
VVDGQEIELTGIRFACAECDKAYSSRSHLVQHERAAHRGDRCVCPQEGCGKAYTNLSHLTRHQQAAHRGMRSVCPRIRAA